MRAVAKVDDAPATAKSLREKLGPQHAEHVRRTEKKGLEPTWNPLILWEVLTLCLLMSSCNHALILPAPQTAACFFADGQEKEMDRSTGQTTRHEQHKPVVTCSS